MRPLLGLAGAALVLTLVACSSSSSSSSSSSVSSSPTTTSAGSTATTAGATPTTAATSGTTPSSGALTKPVVTVPPGPPPTTLVITDLTVGTGAAVTASSTLTVQYVGVSYTLKKQFDASWDDGSGQPVMFPLSGVIPGWQQGLIGMKVGGRRELIIPPSLGYGANPPTAAIAPNDTLIFVIDLVGVS